MITYTRWILAFGVLSLAARGGGGSGGGTSPNAPVATATPTASPAPASTSTPSAAPVTQASCPGFTFNGTQYVATLVFYAVNQQCGGASAYFLPGQNGQNLAGSVSLTVDNPAVVVATPLSGTLNSPGNPGTDFLYTAAGSGTTLIHVTFVTASGTSTGTITVMCEF